MLTPHPTSPLGGLVVAGQCGGRNGRGKGDSVGKYYPAEEARYDAPETPWEQLMLQSLAPTLTIPSPKPPVVALTLDFFGLGLENPACGRNLQESEKWGLYRSKVMHELGIPRLLATSRHSSDRGRRNQAQALCMSIVHLISPKYAVRTCIFEVKQRNQLSVQMYLEVSRNAVTAATRATIHDHASGKDKASAPAQQNPVI
ncbi:uncharacterized protein EDB93DRAFT_1103981 [Suillus bovinus]|uniref:uncharacterized protein n=1 Tax=Suillus bovinus TaxID=48563 RepID=UPI001B86FA8F|nr:uncharacterized protein EDB93DRAFT_1103981 [Suillus bovinus]KAG2147908.1 hypothetical protein EDB93DRAFT_1103981 [Suillus bovinus]